MKLRCCRNFAPTRGGSAGGAAGGCLRSAAPADAGTRLTAMAAACGRRGAAPGSRGGADCARQVLVPGPSPGPWSPPLNLADPFPLSHRCRSGACFPFLLKSYIKRDCICQILTNHYTTKLTFSLKKRLQHIHMKMAHDKRMMKAWWIRIRALTSTAWSLWASVYLCIKKEF